MRDIAALQKTEYTLIQSREEANFALVLRESNHRVVQQSSSRKLDVRKDQAYRLMNSTLEKYGSVAGDTSGTGNFTGKLMQADPLRLWFQPCQDTEKSSSKNSVFSNQAGGKLRVISFAAHRTWFDICSARWDIKRKRCDIAEWLVQKECHLPRCWFILIQDQETRMPT